MNSSLQPANAYKNKKIKECSKTKYTVKYAGRKEQFLNKSLGNVVELFERRDCDQHDLG